MVEDAEYFKMLERMLRAGSRRAGQGDEVELKEFAKLRISVDDLLRDSIHNQLKRGKSWTDIGFALGVSRQAAFKKYNKKG